MAKREDANQPKPIASGDARYVPDLPRQVAALRLLYEAALRRAAAEREHESA